MHTALSQGWRSYWGPWLLDSTLQHGHLSLNRNVTWSIVILEKKEVKWHGVFLRIDLSHSTILEWQGSISDRRQRHFLNLTCDMGTRIKGPPTFTEITATSGPTLEGGQEKSPINSPLISIQISYYLLYSSTYINSENKKEYTKDLKENCPWWNGDGRVKLSNGRPRGP